MSQNNNKTSIKENENKPNELDVNLEEYRNLTGQILKRIEFQQRLLNYQILFIGIIITAGLSLLRFVNVENSQLNKTKELVNYFLLLSPFPFYFISWSFSNQDTMIVALARYININLRSRIKKLIGCKDILQFEDFLNEEKKIRAKKLGIISTLGEEYLLPLLSPTILITIYIIENSHNINVNEILHNLSSPNVLLLIINIVFLILTIILKIKTGIYYQRVTEDDN